MFRIDTTSVRPNATVPFYRSAVISDPTQSQHTQEMLHLRGATKRAEGFVASNNRLSEDKLTHVRTLIFASKVAYDAFVAGQSDQAREFTAGRDLYNADHGINVSVVFTGE